MNMYKRLLFSLLALSTTSVLYAQADATPSSGSSKSASSSAASDDAAAKLGIRFVLQESQPGGKVYMALGEKKFKSFELKMGQLTKRQPYPKTENLMLYNQEPVKGVKMTPIINTPIGGDRTGNVLCLITGTAGNYNTIFLPESEAKRSRVLLINNTDMEYMIEVKNPPMGEQSQINLKPGARYVFGKGINSATPVQDYACKLLQQFTMKNGEKRWITDRSFFLAPAKTNGTIFLLTAAPGSKSMMFQKILVFPENS
jgi:hypothetical protein